MRATKPVTFTVAESGTLPGAEQVIVNVFVPVFAIITSSVLPKGLLLPDQSPDAIQELGTAPETEWEISTD